MVTLQFVPYSEIEDLGSARRVKKLIDIVKENKIVLLQGRLKKEEETDLIAITMEEVGAKFKGIELAVINPDDAEATGLKKLRGNFFGFLLGDRQGLTVIGPANIVKEIKKDPNKIELLTKETKKKKGK
ncbi:hypothetical protein CL615_01025 [archaeon]|jgi:hypothetical protein|nr:hypothetical protein [archaeon]MDP6547849.1 DUF2073 domain-containing protein [Candidatus Woesearchaeota archaeon]|tara:strand:- start:23829 stop:24215 length:387 start_codon:yes stop_codon:yes gene_type:complete